MKKTILKLVVIATLVLQFAGCAQYYPSSAFLELAVPLQSPGIYDGSLCANITGSDNRPSNTLLAYALGDENVAIPSADISLQEAIVGKYKAGLSEQGLVMNGCGTLDIEVGIAEMNAAVTKNSWTYDTVAKTQLVITISTDNGEFSKKFSRESQKTTFFKPKTAALEKMLNELVSGLIDEILHDSAIATEIRGS